MTGREERYLDASMARMLRTALAAALTPGATTAAQGTARSAAQIVGLTGLDAGLVAVAERHGTVRSPRLVSLAARLGELVVADSFAEFRAADDEIAELAAAVALEPAMPLPPMVVEGVEVAFAEPAAEIGVPTTITLAEALDGLPIEGAAAIRDARLTPPVATALRAALEWLSADTARPLPFRVRTEDSLLEVTCEAVHPGGLAPAHSALAAVDGSLAPVGETMARASANAWAVRVPAWSARPAFLMLEQGALALALPWHSVLRLSLVPSIELQMRGRGLATPVLPPLAPLADGVGERPVVAVAHGLKRGLVVADRLVWRLAAVECVPDEPPPLDCLSRAVRSEEGDLYWVVDPGTLLTHVPLPSLPESRPKPQPAATAEPVASAAPESAPAVETTPATVASVEPPAAEPTAVVERSAVAIVEEPPAVAAVLEELPVLDAADVEPLMLRAEDVEPIAAEPGVAEPVAALPDVIERAPEQAPSEEAPAVAPEVPEWIRHMTTGDAPAAQILDAPLSARAAAVSTEAPEPLPALVPLAPDAAADESRLADVSPGTRRVLVAEDSLAAGRFLARMLEQWGFAPHVVESAAGLEAALEVATWSLVCVDVDLPDAPGPELLARTATRLARSGVPCVALVRDDLDAHVADLAGVRRWLRKPFDREEVAHLLRVTGLVSREAS